MVAGAVCVVALRLRCGASVGVRLRVLCANDFRNDFLEALLARSVREAPRNTLRVACYTHHKQVY
jgi:hypothetical protein